MPWWHQKVSKYPGQWHHKYNFFLTQIISLTLCGPQVETLICCKRLKCPTSLKNLVSNWTTQKWEKKRKQQLLIWRKKEFRDQSFKIEICICFLLFSCLCSFLAEEEEEEVDKCDLAQFESFPAAMFSSVYFEDNRDNQTFLPKHLHGQLFKQ